MSNRLEDLASKRAALIAQSTSQRAHLKENIDDIETHLAGIDRGVEVARRILKHPLVLAGGIALFALIGPGKILRIASRGALLFSTGKRVMKLLGR